MQRVDHTTDATLVILVFVAIAVGLGGLAWLTKESPVTRPPVHDIHRDSPET